MARPRSSRRHIVLYSGGQDRRNALIHESLLALALRRSEKRKPGKVRMTYLAFTQDGAADYYRRFVRRIGRLVEPISSAWPRMTRPLRTAARRDPAPQRHYWPVILCISPAATPSTI